MLPQVGSCGHAATLPGLTFLMIFQPTSYSKAGHPSTECDAKSATSSQRRRLWWLSLYSFVGWRGPCSSFSVVERQAAGVASLHIFVHVNN
jgi:hypothetical protein